MNSRTGKQAENEAFMKNYILTFCPLDNIHQILHLHYPLASHYIGVIKVTSAVMNSQLISQTQIVPPFDVLINVILRSTDIGAITATTAQILKTTKQQQRLSRTAGDSILSILGS